MNFVPYTMGSDAEFEACIPFTLAEEGRWPWKERQRNEFSNDAHDPGGATMEGIIQREYDLFRRRNGLKMQSVFFISTDELYTIYNTQYWQPECPQVPRGLSLSLFDQNVNEGPREGLILLQRSLGFLGNDVNGIWGEKTADAIHNIKSVRQMIVNYSNHRANYYRSLHTFQFFGSDWLRRTKNIENASIKLMEQGT